MQFNIEIVPTPMRPLARTSYFAARTVKAQILAKAWRPSCKGGVSPIFVIGCGRSGTTLLGRLLGMHPQIKYLNEPYDLWAAIESATDFLQLYSRGEHYCLLDGSFVTPSARQRFGRLMSSPTGRILVEKSPINTLRIGYLDALAPDARYAYIVRDGVEVVQSIVKLAGVTNAMAFRKPLNDWWGVGGAKWVALAKDGRAAGYYPDELHLLSSDAQRGAYEWLVSMHQAEIWRARLGVNLTALSYHDLIDDPKGTLRVAAEGLQLPCPGDWLDDAAVCVRRRNARSSVSLALPRQMYKDFNNYQEDFGFRGRAVLLT